MAVTHASFRARFREFARTDQAVVEAEIANATRTVDVRKYGLQADDVIGLEVAHRLALRPNGEFARLKPMKGDKEIRTTYGELLKAARRRVLPGDRVP